MKRDDFVFTIGYQGDTALVDGTAKRQYGRLSTSELAARGMLKPALCSALYSQKQDEIEAVLAAFRKRSASPNVTIDQMKRTLGVYSIPENIMKVKVL